MVYHVCLSVKLDDLVMIVDVCNTCMLMYRATYWMDTFKMHSISSVDTSSCQHREYDKLID